MEFAAAHAIGGRGEAGPTGNGDFVEDFAGFLPIDVDLAADAGSPVFGGAAGDASDLGHGVNFFGTGDSIPVFADLIFGVITEVVAHSYGDAGGITGPLGAFVHFFVIGSPAGFELYNVVAGLLRDAQRLGIDVVDLTWRWRRGEFGEFGFEVSEEVVPFFSEPDSLPIAEDDLLFAVGGEALGKIDIEIPKGVPRDDQFGDALLRSVGSEFADANAGGLIGLVELVDASFRSRQVDLQGLLTFEVAGGQNEGANALVGGGGAQGFDHVVREIALEGFQFIIAEIDPFSLGGEKRIFLGIGNQDISKFFVFVIQAVIGVVEIIWESEVLDQLRE